MERFGLFDENFFPVYYEDWDMMQRELISGAKYVSVFRGEKCPAPHGKPRCGGPGYDAMIQACGPHLRDYYRRKWGVTDIVMQRIVFDGNQLGHSEGVIGYHCPFNDSNAAIGFWKPDPDHLANLHAIYDPWERDPNHGIYR